MRDAPIRTSTIILAEHHSSMRLQRRQTGFEVLPASEVCSSSRLCAARTPSVKFCL